MNVAELLPRLGPPHDPLSLLLTRFDGWRGIGSPWCEGLAADDPEALSLALVAPKGPDALGPAATLAGALLPGWCALTPDDTLYLLDRRGRRLTWFDRCRCVFAPLPCLNAKNGPLALTTTVAIAANRSLLAIAGTAGGRGRIVVLQRATLSIVVIVEQEIEPTALALSRGCVAVTDGTSGAILVFDLNGRLLRRIEEVGFVSSLTALDDGRLLAVNAVDVRIVSTSGEAQETISLASGRALVPALPFVVDGAAKLDLAAFCDPPRRKPALFDETGAPSSDKPVPHLAAAFASRGRHVTQALDSAIEACQWHRIRFRADIPAKCRLSWRTRAAPLDFPPDMVAEEGEPGWSDAQSFLGPLHGDLEFLVTSGEGRWLWLEAVLEGDGTATPRLCEIAADFPRISLARYLPAAMVAEPSSADLTHRFLSIFDTGFREVERRIDVSPRLYDPRTTPAKMLDWLGSWVGLAFSRADSEASKRRLIRQLPRLFRKRGTLEGLEETLAVLMGFADLQCEAKVAACGPRCEVRLPVPSQPRLVLEHWRLRRWLFLGLGRLSESSRLWGESILNRTRLGGSQPLGSTRLTVERDPLRDPFHAHAHRLSVFLPAARAKGASAKGRIEAVVRREVPAHVDVSVHWVEPNMRLGIQSTLGFDAVLGARAPGRFGQAPLGDASALVGSQPSPMGLRPGSAAIGRSGFRGACTT